MSASNRTLIKVGASTETEMKEKQSRVEDALHAISVAAGENAFENNAATGEFGDMEAMDFIDPTKVTRLGLQNAASIASPILAKDCIIAEAPKHGSPAPGELPQGD